MARTKRTSTAWFAVTASALLVTSGCLWGAPGQGANRQASNVLEDDIGIDTVGSLAPLWTATVDEGAAGDPVTSTEGVHVDDSRHVYAFDFATGARRWSVGVDAPLEMRQPWVRGSGELFVSWWNPSATPATDPTVQDLTMSLDPATGASLGEVAEGLVGSRRGTRVLLWSNEYVQVGGPFGTNPFWAVQLEVWDTESASYVCCPGWFGLFDPDEPPLPPPGLTLGSEWIVHAGQGVLDGATLPPVVGNGVRGYSIANPSTCQGAYTCPTWATPTDGTITTPPVLDNGESMVFVGTDAGTVYAVEAATGAVVWTAPVGSAVTDSPALAGGSLYVPTASGALVVLDRSDGTVLWSGSAASAVTQQPAVAGGVVFTGHADGSLQAFDAAGCGGPSCPALWSGSTGSEISGAPAVDRGVLYAGTADGRVVAYGLPPG